MAKGNTAVVSFGHADFGVAKCSDELKTWNARTDSNIIVHCVRELSIKVRVSLSELTFKDA